MSTMVHVRTRAVRVGAVLIAALAVALVPGAQAARRAVPQRHRATAAHRARARRREVRGRREVTGRREVRGRREQRHRHPARAHASAASGVRIVDFSFSPGTTTVHVGDTVTWTNSGQQPHSATANNGSFDTGILDHGQSGSHTFAQAGTFTYYCKVHPWMHGTIVVLAAVTTTPKPASGSTSTTPASGSKAATASSSTAPSGPTLPFTGLNVGLALLAGLALMGLGLAVRRLAR